MTVEIINDVTNVTVTQAAPVNVEIATSGMPGAAGPANTLTVGTVDALDPGTTPTVVITGSSPSQTINFGIPAGVQILQGTTAPSSGLGKIGFWYINTSTWDVYEKTDSATWTSRGNIKGATGSTGPAPNLSIGTVTNATAGAAPSATITGTNPNYSLNLNFPLANWTVGTTSTLSPTDSATVTIGGTALNPTLSIGIPAGAKILTGAVDPTSGTGGQGDWYINTTTWDIFEKTSSTVWISRGNIKGAVGDAGPAPTLNSSVPVTTLAPSASPTASITGSNPYTFNLSLPAAAQQYVGDDATRTSGLGLQGDIYTVTTGGTNLGNVYKKTSSTVWTLQGNIRGPAGTGNVGSGAGVIGNLVSYAASDGSIIQDAGFAASDVVRITQTQTISGNKTFSALLTATSGIDVTGATTTTSLTTNILQVNTTSNFDGEIGVTGGLTLYGGAIALGMIGSRVLSTNASGEIAITSITTTEVNYLSGVTSSVQTQLNNKAASVHTHTSSAITDFNTAVDARISTIVAGAPSTLDTLDELAAALGDDPNFATTMTNLIGTKANSNNAVFTGTVTVPDGALSIADTSGLQTALNSKATYSTDDIGDGVIAAWFDAGVEDWFVAGSGLTMSDFYSLQSNAVLIAGTQSIGGTKTFTSLLTASAGLTVTGTVTATTFSGSGASLTSLPAGQLTGTVPIGNIPTGTTGTTVALGNHTHSGYVDTTTTQSIAGVKTFTSGTVFNIASSGALSSPITITNTGSGAGTAAAFMFGTVGSTSSLKGAVIFENTGVGNGRGNLHIALDNTADTSNATIADAVLTFVPGGAATFVSSVTASSFSGVGTSLTALNASNLGSGTVAQARLAHNVQRFIFTTGSEARPTGTTYVEWIGPVTPTNAIDGDTWTNTA